MRREFVVRNRRIANLLIKLLVKKGNLGRADKIGYQVMCKLAKVKPVDVSVGEVIAQVVERIRPHIGVKVKKVAGRKIKVPYLYTQRRSLRSALVWIIEVAKESFPKDLVEGIVVEIMNAYEKKGMAYGQKRSLVRAAVYSRYYMKYLKVYKKRTFKFKKWLRLYERYFKEMNPKTQKEVELIELKKEKKNADKVRAYKIKGTISKKIIVETKRIRRSK